MEKNKEGRHFWMSRKTNRHGVYQSEVEVRKSAGDAPNAGTADHLAQNCRIDDRVSLR
jgi:hypothetical protein